MAYSLYLLFNHEPTALQEEDAFACLHVKHIHNPPPDLKAIWRQIPPDLPGIDSYLRPVKEWLKEHSRKGDYVLIQGDFGACFIMVNFAFANGLIPVYSTTERVAVEKHGNDGIVNLIHQFKHQIFRKYGV